MTTRRILFVCTGNTGNTGRSVAAEALAKRPIAAPGLVLTAAARGVAVDRRNDRAEPHLATLLVVRGTDLSSHRAAGWAHCFTRLPRAPAGAAWKAGRPALPWPRCAKGGEAWIERRRACCRVIRQRLAVG